MTRMTPPENAPEVFGVMTFDTWTGSYRDTYNNVWAIKRYGRKQWEVAERGPGNVTILHSRHRDVLKALAAADAISRSVAA